MKKHPRTRKKIHTKKVGMPPGVAVYVGDLDVENQTKPKITHTVFDANQFTESNLDEEALSRIKINDNQKLWINVHGVHDAALIKKIGHIFKLHPLVIEDILNTKQRPKIDEFKDYIFIEAQHFTYDKQTMSVNAEQISMVLGHNFLLTFQERSTGAFEPVRARLRIENAPMRMLGVDYLTYALLDSVVDRYFNVLEDVSEDSETLEERLLNNPSNVELQNIHQLKHACIELRRAVWPLREVINNLTRNEKGIFQSATMPYLRDIYDHTVNFIESLESIRDSLASMMDIYMASVSQRVNLEVRALTVVAMLFMPATLIAGIFGMNFHYMPWINHQKGFWWAIAIMIGIALMMLLIFWRRQWLTSKN